MLKYIYEIFTGKKIPDIQPSPPPTEMIQYGGYITSQDYQQKIEQLDGSYQKELDDNNFASICNMFKKQQSAGIYWVGSCLFPRFTRGNKPPTTPAISKDNTINS
mgnify:FL=1